MKLGELLEGEDFQVSHPECLNQEVIHWTERSSDVREESWFIAVRGESHDGHQFISDALEHGAKGLVVEKPWSRDASSIFQVIVPDSRRILSRFSSRWYGFPSRRLEMIGVTGTNGKTTITFLIQHLLEPFSPCGLVGTIESRWKNERLPSLNTTPGPHELNAVLDQMLYDGISSCVMEVSSHALKQGRVSDVEFRTALFTNLTQDHLDYHKTFEDYFDSKKKLFFEFPSVRKRIINLDDPYGQKLWKGLPQEASKVSYGIRHSVDYRAENVSLSLEGTEFVLSVKNKKYPVKTGLLCLHNVYNLLASFAALSEMGYPLESLLERVRIFQSVPGRLERFRHSNGAIIFVDYAHTPDAFINIYGSLGPLKQGRLISIFGCGGNRDSGKRPLMGRIASENSDHVIITSDNPREENPEEIIRQILEGIHGQKESGRLDVVPDRHEAIIRALEMAQPKDIILILGKGHEDYQIIGHEKFHFSDKEIVEQWVEERRANPLLKS